MTVIVSLKMSCWCCARTTTAREDWVAMLALASQGVKDKSKLRASLLGVGIFGTCLFYGDGVITPAISVLSAVEGLEVVSPRFRQGVIPLTIVILLCLFLVQKRGTGGIGRFFGPLTLLWFFAIGALGVLHIIDRPEILTALSPHHALRFMFAHLKVYQGVGADIEPAPATLGTRSQTGCSRDSLIGRTPPLQAGLWGLLAGGGLVLGAAVAWFMTVPQRVIAGIMAFGSGVLISALAFELMEEAYQRGGLDSTGMGFVGGAVVYTIVNWWLTHRGAKHRKRSGEGVQPSEADAGGSGMAIALGALLDGIPESIVIGLSLLKGRGVSLVAVIAIFLSNIPEGLTLPRFHVQQVMQPRGCVPS